MLLNGDARLLTRSKTLEVTAGDYPDALREAAAAMEREAVSNGGRALELLAIAPAQVSDDWDNFIGVRLTLTLDGY